MAATSRIATETDDARIGEVLVEASAALLAAGDVRLLMLDLEGAWLVLRQAVGPAAAQIGARQPSSGGVWGLVLKERAPVRLADGPLAPPAEAPAAPVLAVPLRFKSELQGVLWAARSPSAPPFSASDAMALQVLADLAAARLGGSSQASALRARARELEVVDPTWRPPPDQAGDFVLVTRNRRDIIDADEAAARVLGYPREELLRLALFDIMPMPALDSPVDNLAAIRGELVGGKSFVFDTVVRRRDGSLIPVRLELRNWPTPEGFVGRGVFHDLRAEERAQAQALQTDKVRLLGEIGSGLAHALNSPLAIVMGNTEMLLSETTDPDVRALIQPARDAAERISQAVQDLQRFARPVVPSAWTEVDVGQLARETVEQTRPLWEAAPAAQGRPIRVCLEAEPVSLVRAHVLELHEALRELLANAVQALPQGGTITVRSEEAEGHVVLSVADDGVGMSDHVRQFCLEPFFTTRRPQANGLGLNRVYHTALRHRGSVHVESEEGQGTRVTLRLPLLSKS
ncbi:MAG TPA: ATP-binding protein [Chloroflexota bacterium]